MKKLLFLSCIIIASVSKSFGYSTVVVKDSISTNTTWTCDKQYLLQGYVYVTAGATLTIDPGVIIRGDKDTKGALIIERGAKIRAMGTPTQPIVFTSNQEAGSRTYGDWGGVIICGNAPTNWTAGQAQVEGGPRSFYGGTNVNDNSGEMHYVRIEFGGVAFSPNNEVNSLTLCGVGDGTQIDHIQVSYAGDDAFEWFGGTVNAKYLVAVRTWDDDMDSDAGFQGTVQFGAIIRDNVADLSGSKALETDSYLSGSYSGIPYDNTKINRGVFSNLTIIGPVINPGSTTTDPNFVAAVHVRRGSGISLLNSVIAGFPCGLLIDESSASYGSTVANIGSSINDFQFRNNIVCGTSNLTFNKDAVFVRDGARNLTPTTANSDTVTTTDWSTLAGTPNLGPQSFLRNPAYGNRTYATQQASVFLGNPYNLSNPNLVPNSTSPICYRTWTSANGTVTKVFNPSLPISYDTTGDSMSFNVPTVPPDFTTSKASHTVFTKVNYVGAFAGRGLSSDNWMKGWCEFDPNNAFYDTICYVAPPTPIDTNVGINTIVAGFENKVFPNPAANSATLQMQFTQTGLVKVTVLDIAGKLVKEVFNGKVASGVQSFNFSTADFSNGMYIISVQAGTKREMLKFSVVK